jgi:hypothetical protein
MLLRLSLSFRRGIRYQGPTWVEFEATSRLGGHELCKHRVAVGACYDARRPLSETRLRWFVKALPAILCDSGRLVGEMAGLNKTVIDFCLSPASSGFVLVGQLRNYNPHICGLDGDGQGHFQWR